MTGPLPAIVLAAGMSRRMGRFKPLLPLGDRPLIRHVVDTLRCGGADPILVVTGHRADEVGAALIDAGIVLAHNDAYATEHMLYSVKCGLKLLAPDAPAFILSPADYPAVAVDTVRMLIETWRKKRAAFVVPEYAGHRGHPFVVSAQCIPPLLELGAGDSMKTLLTRFERDTVRVPVDDAGVAEDVDTPEDYDRLVAGWASRGMTSKATRE